MTTSSPRSPPDFLPDVGAALPVAPPRIVPVIRLDNRGPVPYTPPVRPSASASPPLSLVRPDAVRAHGPLHAPAPRRGLPRLAAPAARPRNPPLRPMHH
nr:lysine-rich arabinogalactan protein 19-like [Aegilops tauschii subsp. strangulata]